LEISVGVSGRCVGGCGDVLGGVGDVGDVPGMCGNVGVGLVWALWGCKVWGGLEEGGGGGGKMRTMMPKTNAQEVCSIVVELPWRKLLCTLRCWHVKSVVSSQ
jgi:hypothetical protein